MNREGKIFIVLKIVGIKIVYERTNNHVDFVGWALLSVSFSINADSSRQPHYIILFSCDCFNKFGITNFFLQIKMRQDRAHQPVRREEVCTESVVKNIRTLEWCFVFVTLTIAMDKLQTVIIIPTKFGPRFFYFGLLSISIINRFFKI